MASPLAFACCSLTRVTCTSAMRAAALTTSTARTRYALVCSSMRSGCDAAALRLCAKGVHMASGALTLVVSEAGRGHGRGTLALVARLPKRLSLVFWLLRYRELVAPNPAQLSLSKFKLAKSSTDHFFHAEKRASHLITPRGGPTAEYSILSTGLMLELGPRGENCSQAMPPPS
jgi:hypothetical protein